MHQKQHLCWACFVSPCRGGLWHLANAIRYHSYSSQWQLLICHKLNGYFWKSVNRKTGCLSAERNTYDIYQRRLTANANQPNLDPVGYAHPNFCKHAQFYVCHFNPIKQIWGKVIHRGLLEPEELLQISLKAPCFCLDC